MASTYERNLIDVHHHFVFGSYRKAVDDAGGDPSGWPVPAWSEDRDEAAQQTVGASVVILSLTSPGAPIAGSDEGARKLAREANEHCAALRNARPDKYGFFAAMPNALDTQGTLDEIAYALDVLKADGVTLYTRYGEGNCYLGNEQLAPIWSELNKREAVVFIHPTHPVDTNRVSDYLLQPTLDYPHETTRTAYDLILSNTKRNNPNCKVILSHAGGTLPWILPRSATLLRGLSADRLPAHAKTYEEVWDDFKSFYFDIALSQSHEGLHLLLKRVPEDHILYGSDFPYAPPTSISNFREDLETYPMPTETREKIYYKNALRLLPRFAKQ